MKPASLASAITDANPAKRSGNQVTIGEDPPVRFNLSMGMRTNPAAAADMNAIANHGII